MIKYILPILYTPIVLINLAGFDGKGILLMLTSPPAWIIEEFHLFQINNEILRPIIILITYVFWYSFGLFIKKFLQNISIKYLFLFMYSILAIIEIALHHNKMILLAVSSPPFWFNSNNFTKSHPDSFSMLIIIPITMLFWYGFGASVEKIISYIQQLYTHHCNN